MVAVFEGIFCKNIMCWPKLKLTNLMITLLDMNSDEKLIIILGKTDDFSVGEIFGEIFQAPFKDCDFGYFFGYFWEIIGEILSKSSGHTGHRFFTEQECLPCIV